MRTAKRILVLSDSHGYSLSGLLMKAESLGKIDAVFHLGDGFRDMDGFLAEFPYVFRVAGNCDFSGGERECLAPLFGKRFFLTHGHAYRVKSTMQLLKARAYETEADCVLFGHTHKPLVTNRNGVLVVNPGSLAYPRQPGRRPSYAIMTLEESRPPEVEIQYL